MNALNESYVAAIGRRWLARGDRTVPPLGTRLHRVVTFVWSKRVRLGITVAGRCTVMPACVFILACGGNQQFGTSFSLS